MIEMNRYILDELEYSKTGFGIKDQFDNNGNAKTDEIPLLMEKFKLGEIDIMEEEVFDEGFNFGEINSNITPIDWSLISKSRKMVSEFRNRYGYINSDTGERGNKGAYVCKDVYVSIVSSPSFPDYVAI